MRHRWVKLRIHVYICRKCGCGRVNEQDVSGRWYAVWHMPNGQSVALAKTPACTTGEKTDTYLAKYAAQIATALAPCADDCASRWDDTRDPTVTDVVWPCDCKESAADVRTPAAARD